MKKYLLYHTAGCHLCELAESVLYEVAQDFPMVFKTIDIAEQDCLIEAYGIRIPVLREDVSGRELGWPFDKSAVALWMEG